MLVVVVVGERFNEDKLLCLDYELSEEVKLGWCVPKKKRKLLVNGFVLVTLFL